MAAQKCFKCQEDWVVAKGLCKNCLAEKGHQYEKSKSTKEGEKTTSFKPVELKNISSSKDKYYGGNANEPHVHVYPGGCHLKLGKNRQNLVQNGGVQASQCQKAYDALDDHPLGDTLRPWVDAALRYFGADPNKYKT